MYSKAINLGWHPDLLCSKTPFMSRNREQSTVHRSARLIGVLFLVQGSYHHIIKFKVINLFIKFCFLWKPIIYLFVIHYTTSISHHAICLKSKIMLTRKVKLFLKLLKTFFCQLLFFFFTGIVVNTSKTHF